jgi:hypothetical protein
MSGCAALGETNKCDTDKGLGCVAIWPQAARPVSLELPLSAQGHSEWLTGWRYEISKLGAPVRDE